VEKHSTIGVPNEESVQTAKFHRDSRNARAGQVARSDARERLIGNIVPSMKSVPQRVRELQIRHFYNVDPAYGARVATGIGLTIEGVLAFGSKVAAAD
jgi:catalase